MNYKYKPKTKPNYTVSHHKGRPTKGHLEQLKRFEEVKRQYQVLLPSADYAVDENSTPLISTDGKRVLMRYKSNEMEQMHD